jgi:macrolide transport system ATP-binding/permease protein
VDALVLQPLPVADPGRLVSVYRTVRGPANSARMSYPDFVYVRGRTDVFEQALALIPFRAALGRQDWAEVTAAELVSGTYCSTLGLVPSAGRGFNDEDERTDSPVAMISHRLWVRLFKQDPEVPGQVLRINGYQFTVVGVMPQTFRGLSLQSLWQTDVWVPLGAASHLGRTADWFEGRTDLRLQVKARLRQGVSLAEAASALSVIGAQLEKTFPSRSEPRDFALRPASAVRVSERVEHVAVPVAAGIVLLSSLILFLACTNIANLVLARGIARNAEMAVRMALGATRLRIVRLVMAENAVLAITGGVLGVGMAHVLLAAVSHFEPPAVAGVPFRLEIALGSRALAFSSLATIFTALVVGLAPALRASRSDLATSLGVGEDGGGRVLSTRRVLVSIQVAASVLLLVVAGLFVRSFARANTAPQGGLEARHVAFAGVELSLHNLEEERACRFYERLLEGAKRLPGHVVSGVTDDLPVVGPIAASNTVLVDPDDLGRDSVAPGGRIDFGRFARYAAVTPGYLQALRLPIVRGRGFLETDTAQSPLVAVVSETAARRFWPNQDPLGRRFSIPGDEGSLSLEVVGIARDDGVERGVRYGSTAPPLFYVPFAQRPSSDAYLVVRAQQDPRSLIDPLKALVRHTEADIAVTESSSLEDYIKSQSFVLRTAASVMTSLALSGLMLAAIGLYGLMAYMSERRAREVGVRMALGATERDVMRLALGQGGRVVAIGAVAGLLLALWAGRLISGMLFGVSGHDPLAFCGVVALLVVTALLACYGPTRRLTRVSPADALRHL